jgi:asparagine synthase (glutamine-hydrolysing)
LNGIFGLVNLDGSPVESEAVAAMQAAMAFWAVDEAASWKEGEAGLGCAHLATTPEAAGERLPLVDALSGLALTAGARLDNRDELLRLLDLPTGRAAPAVPDSQIILQAYLRWGPACVSHLDGDWHFAVWDSRLRKLFLGRDHHGATGLYYVHSPHYFAFASSKKALLALEQTPKRPNLLRLAQILTTWSGDGVQTGYEAILRLPPAHTLTLTPQGVSVERYWFPENVPELALKTDDEYVEAFLEVFTQAVSARLRSDKALGVTLSGGLDSGAVTAVAAGLLREDARSLKAFTAVPLSDPRSAPRAYTSTYRFGDETGMAQATARQAGNIEHTLIASENITPLAGIERMLWVHDEPGHAAGNQYWLAALLEAARQAQLGVLLTGQMGNATISWTGSGESLLPFLRHGDLPGFRDAFQAARRGSGLGTRRALRRFVLKPLLLPFLHPLLSAWQSRPGAWQEFSALRSDFARKLNLHSLMRQAGYIPGMGPLDPLQQRLDTIQPGQSTLGAAWLEKGAAYGLEVRDPTQDRRVIELCLAIPEHQYQRGGVERWLIRRAMQGYLPDAVRLNTRRGLQAADLGRRVLESKGEVQYALRRLEQHELARQMLDLPRMEAVLASLQSGPNPQNTAACGSILLRGLMTGIFLLRF